MDTWCFIDESWHETPDEKIGVLAAIVCPWRTHEKLTREMFHLRKKYFGEEHARDCTRELKGLDLFSNYAFRMVEKHGFSKNLTVAREVLEFAKRNSIRVAAGTIYRENKQPALLAPNPKLLAAPFRELCKRLLAHLSDDSRALLVFDQRLGAQENISISIHNYLAGLSDGRNRIRPVPLVAVSNVCAGLQLADIAASVIGRHATGDNRFVPWHKMVSALQIEAFDYRLKKVFGLFRLQQIDESNYHPRRARIKKEPGSSGREAY
jgi:hypothetical protein